MSELEELPSWAGRSTEEVKLPPETPAKAAQPADQATPAEAPQQPAPPAAPTPPDGPTVSAPAAGAAAAGAAAAGAAAAAQPTPTAPPMPPAEPPTSAQLPPAGTQPPAQAQPTDLAAPPTQPVIAAQPVQAQPVQAQPVAAAPIATGPTPEPVRRRRSRLSKILLALLGLAFLVGAGAIGYFLAISQDDDDQTEATGTAEQVAAPAVENDAATDETATETDDGATVGTDEADDTTGAADDEDAQTVTVDVDEDEAADGAEATDDGSDPAAADDGNEADPMNDGDRQAIFRGGKVYLTGAVPSEEVAELIVAKAAAVVGPDNVVNEYEIDPTVQLNPGDSAPLFVEDVVLFEFNSVEVAQPFLPILDLGVLLLSQNPQATVTIVTRTDAVGSEEVNLEVARRRAQAVINYWVGKGVDPDQIVADPRGEEGASEDDDPETAARQRRAEFIITGLLD